MKKRRNTRIVALILSVLAVCMLAACAASGPAGEMTEEMIARNVKLLLDAPDEYLESHNAEQMTMDDFANGMENGGEGSFGEGYQEYLATVFSTEECTERFCESVYTYRCANLIYPTITSIEDFTVEIEDVKVELELEESHIYSVEATAVLTLGGEVQNLPISTSVQLEEDGRISSVKMTDSMFQITDTAMKWVNSNLN